MEETAPANADPDDDGPPLPAAPRRRLLRRAGPALCLAVAALGAAQFFAARFWSADVRTISIRLPVAIAALSVVAIGLLIAGTVIHFITRWRRPVRRLARALDEFRGGERTIGQLGLAESAGGLAPLLPVLQELCRDLRGYRRQVAALELEMSQRVAQRTDALERSLSGLRAQATRDVLTGLYNRRMLEQCFDDVIARCRAEGAPLCLMMIDVDDFKLLNDTLGHATGDELLKAIGQLIRSSIRADDLGFRCGGDEFIIICPGASKEQAAGLGRRLTELVDALARPLAVARRPRLCIGISALDETGDQTDARTLLAEADRRLYAAKAVRKQRRGSPGRAA